MIRGAGSYYDGESAVRREVTVDVTSDGLQIVEPPDQRELAFWEYRELRPVDEVPGDGPYRIRAEHGGARLVLTDRYLIAEVAARAPRLAARERDRSSSSFKELLEAHGVQLSDEAGRFRAGFVIDRGTTRLNCSLDEEFRALAADAEIEISVALFPVD